MLSANSCTSFSMSGFPGVLNTNLQPVPQTTQNMLNMEQNEIKHGNTHYVIQINLSWHEKQKGFYLCIAQLHSNVNGISTLVSYGQTRSQQEQQPVCLLMTVWHSVRLRPMMTRGSSKVIWRHLAHGQRNGECVSTRPNAILYASIEAIPLCPNCMYCAA